METFVLVMLALVIYGFIMTVEITWFHTRFDGQMKRGIPILRERIPTDFQDFFVNLQSDLRDEDTGTYIKKQHNAVLIQYFPINKSWYHRMNGGGALLYVAYVDLDETEPCFQYRVAISPLLFFVFFVTIFLMGFWYSGMSLEAMLFLVISVLGLVLYHFYQRERIFRYIKRAMQTYLF